VYSRQEGSSFRVAKQWLRIEKCILVEERGGRDRDGVESTAKFEMKDIEKEDEVDKAFWRYIVGEDSSGEVSQSNAYLRPNLLNTWKFVIVHLIYSSEEE